LGERPSGEFGISEKIHANTIEFFRWQAKNRLFSQITGRTKAEKDQIGVR